ncbi:hypothetical protein [Candidatus Poriferisodalis sp.]|uniref:hypothetical protein n=1 Tax=Candidatus Poriferisodalis sp. TaxID=3101277 RepID=UPI003B02D0ED
MRQTTKRRARRLRRRLRRKGTAEEQRARVQAHLRLGSSYVSINDALDALNREDYAAARTATEQVMHHCADALETLSVLDSGTSA